MASKEELARLLANFEARQNKSIRAARLERASVLVSEDGTRSVGVRQTLASIRTPALEGAQALLGYLTVADLAVWFTQVAPDPVAGHLWLDPTSVLMGVSAGGWEPLSDQSGAAAVAGLREALVTDDGKVEVWRQAAPPATAAFGDLWFDDNDTPYRWENATWVSLLPNQSRSNLYISGEAGWGFEPDGDAQVKDLNVLGQLAAPLISADAISLGGVDLATTLGGSSIGKILSARLAQQGSNIACSTTLTKIMELNCGTVQGGRTYRVKTSCLADGSGTLALTDRIKLDYRYTIDGSAPTTTSPTMDGGFNDPYFQFGDYTVVMPEAEVDIASECQLRVGLFAHVLSGAGTYAIYAGPSARSRPVMALYDDGPSGARNDAAITLTGGGTTRFVKTFNPTWANGCQGATWNELANSAYCDVGNSATYGNGMFGAVGFNSSDIIPKLSGVVTMVSLVLRWRCRTRSTSGGLDVRILSHNYATLSAFTNAWFPQQYDNPPGDITSVVTYGNAAPGVTVDTSLGTTLFSQLRSGTRKGICITNSGSPSYNSQPAGTGTFYSYGSYQPQLIFTYDGTS